MKRGTFLTTPNLLNTATHWTVVEQLSTLGVLVINTWCKEQLYLRDLHILERTTIHGKTNSLILQFHSQIFYSCLVYLAFSHDFGRNKTVFSNRFFLRPGKLAESLCQTHANINVGFYGTHRSCCEPMATNYSRFC